MADQYYRQRFQSTIDANEFLDKYIWSSELNDDKKFPLDIKGKIMLPYFEEKIEVFCVKMSQSEIRTDRQKRASNHFKKEIYQTLPKGSTKQKHHAKKHDIKN